VANQHARYFGTELRDGSLVPGGKRESAGQVSNLVQTVERISLVNCERHANMRSLFRRIKRNGAAMSTLRILGTALVLAFGSQPIQSVRAAESAVVTPLMLKELADIPGKEMLMITVDYPPGAVDPVHRHDAHAFVYVLQGSIVMQVRGGKEVTLVPGQTFYEGPNDVHTVGRNASTTEPAKFIVILLKKKGVDVVLPAE
jgi:quercetin dioxygenase-like cupin family protein